MKKASYAFLLLLPASLIAAGPVQSDLPPIVQSDLPPIAPVITPARLDADKVTFRNPVGHTHTCPRCGNVWDHSANAGHTCLNCGTAQYVQDYQPRMVPLGKAVQVPKSDPNCPTGG